jgi:hypothetical protein
VGDWGIGNRGLGFAIRADNGRFFYRLIARVKLFPFPGVAGRFKNSMGQEEDSRPRREAYFDACKSSIYVVETPAREDTC